jgi:hypothetical protein
VILQVKIEKVHELESILNGLRFLEDCEFVSVPKFRQWAATAPKDEILGLIRAINKVVRVRQPIRLATITPDEEPKS